MGRPLQAGWYDDSSTHRSHASAVGDFSCLEVMQVRRMQSTSPCFLRTLVQNYRSEGLTSAIHKNVSLLISLWKLRAASHHIAFEHTPRESRIKE
jgi:hypothetical protein